MSSELIRRRRGAVEVLTLNRPERLNALTPELETAYVDALRDADGDPDVHAIIVTGAGRAFCAGADLSAIQVGPGGGEPAIPPRDSSRYPPLLRTPVIAAVNGACAGAGLAIALQADVRFVGEDAKLTTAFSRRGLIAEHGTSWLLPRLVGRGRASDLLLSGRTFTGRDALDYGLAEFCVAPGEVLDAALAYADDLATNCSPTAVARIKDQLWRDDGRDPLAALTAADEATREAFRWPDVIEGIDAWSSRRAPRFPARHLAPSDPSGDAGAAVR